MWSLGALGAVQAADVQLCLENLRHRGPDSGVCETAAGALGHTRLAIVDVAHGGQPQAYERLHISYNGEIYNHRALRNQYLLGEELAPSRTPRSCTALREAGPSSVELLDGMFAIAILDDETLFLARPDRDQAALPRVRRKYAVLRLGNQGCRRRWNVLRCFLRDTGITRRWGCIVFITSGRRTGCRLQ